MFNRLRRRFILIAMCSVSLVIVFVSLSVNLINFLSINSDLSNMLEMICENQGMVPDFPRAAGRAVGCGVCLSHPKRLFLPAILSYTTMRTVR